MDIEGYAVSKVNEALASTNYLVPYISLRDTGPIWDGFVYVYTDSDKHKNENLKARVPVQVKGELATSKKMFDDKITYSIRTVDLKHYLEGGGVVFFVVRIDDEKKSSQIYAARLLPFTINKILADSGDKQSVSVNIPAFPTGERQINNYFFNMAEDINRQKTSSQLGLGHLVTLEELQKEFSVKRVMISFTDTAIDRQNPYKYMMENSTYQYAELSLGIIFPIRELPPLPGVSEQNSVEISCGGDIFFDSYTNKFTLEKRILSLGKCISITYNLTGEPVATLNFTAIGTLREIINAASFLCNLFKEKVFYIGNAPMKLDVLSIEGKGNIDNFEKYTTDLKTLDKALHMVGFNKDLTLSELSDQDIEALNALVPSVVLQHSVPLENAPDRNHFFAMNLNGHKILLLAMRDSKNKFRLINFFSKGVELTFNDSADETVLKKAPAVIVLGADDFLTMDNIDYGIIYSEISTFSGVDEKYHAEVTQLLLRMLLAYDMKPDSELLACAIRIAAWLCTLSDFSTDAIDTLNYLQTARRQRDLTDAEKSKLVKIIDENSQNNILITGAYIVLQDFADAEKAFAQLSDIERQNLTQWPIMNLWKNRVENSLK